MDWIVVSSSVLAEAVRDVSTACDCVDTVTVSATPDSVIAGRSLNVSPTVRSTLSCTSVANPVSLRVIV